MNLVLNHIRENLAGDLSLEKLARVACFSPWHFHRIFKGQVGESLNAHVNRLRLERAAQALKRTPGVSVTSAALSAGFNSVEHFSRQFRARFGVSANEYRRSAGLKNRKIHQEPPGAGFYHVYEESRRLPVPAFAALVGELRPLHVAYTRGVYGQDGSGLVESYKQLMSWAQANGYFMPGVTRLGISWDDPETTPGSVFRYDFCIEVPREARAEGAVGIQEIAGGVYATVHCAGDLHLVAQGWDFIYRKWLPESGYLPRDLPPLEVFLKGPEEIGWDRFDLQIRVPIEPLQAGI